MDTALNPQDNQVIVKVVLTTEISETFEIQAMKTDTIKKLKSRIFIVKDIAPEK